jgi:hypothetical protein
VESHHDKIQREDLRAERVGGDKAVGAPMPGEAPGVKVTATSLQVDGKTYRLAHLQSLELNLAKPGRSAALVLALACAAVPGGLCLYLSTRPVAGAVAALATVIGYLAIRFLQPETFRLEAKTPSGRLIIARDRDAAELQALRERVRAAQERQAA